MYFDDLDPPHFHAIYAGGQAVIDSGYGAGNVCFVARHETGSTGIYNITVFARKSGTKEDAHEEVKMVKRHHSGQAHEPGSGC